MTTFKNDEFFYVGGDKDITVSVTFSADPESSDRVKLLNAAEAIKFFADNGVHKSWTRKIEVNR